MKVSDQSIEFLGRVVTGDGQQSPYLSGPQLIDFFCRFGYDDEYGAGFPSRWWYAEEKLRGLNGTDQMRDAIEAIFDTRRFLGTEFDLDGVVEMANQFLVYDGCEVCKKGLRYVVNHVAETVVTFELPFQASSEQMNLFISQQSDKCDSKLANGDYDGAITNARSFAESILIEVERKLDQNFLAYDGDFPKLYKRVRKLMNMDDGPYREKEMESVLQLLRGLTTVVDGLAGMSNKMGENAGAIIHH